MLMILVVIMFPPAGPCGLSAGGAGESWHGLADSELGLRVGVKVTARVAAAPTGSHVVCRPGCRRGRAADAARPAAGRQPAAGIIWNPIPLRAWPGTVMMITSGTPIIGICLEYQVYYKFQLY
jgi:hypothetical protein